MCNKIFALRASTSIPRNIRSISPTTTPKEIEDNEGLDLISLSTYEKGRRVIHHCCRWEWLSSFADLLRGWWLQKNGTKGLIREDLHFNIFVVGYVTYSKDCRFCMKMEKALWKKIIFRRLFCFTIFQIYILHYPHKILTDRCIFLGNQSPLLLLTK